MLMQPDFLVLYILWLNFIFGLNFITFAFWYQMVIYDNKFETKENKISTKDKIEPQHIRRWLGILRQDTRLITK